MSFRTGLHIIAVIGLTAVAVALVGLWMEERREVKNSIHENYQEQSAEYSRNAAHNVAQKCNVGTFITIRNCVRDEYDAYYANSSTNQDVKAQQDMALWAEAVFWATIFTGFVGGAAVVYLAKDINVGRSNGRDQSRAYVIAHHVFFNIDDKIVQIVVKNSGQTPAKWFRVEGTLHFYDSRGIYLTMPTGVSVDKRWTGLPNGDDLRAPLTSGGEAANIDRFIASDDPTSGIQVNGTVTYETIFSEVMHSEFSFNLLRENFDKSKSSEKIETSVFLMRTNAALPVYQNTKD